MRTLFLLLLVQHTLFAQQAKLVVGTYTKGASEGIYIYDFNSTNGVAKLLDSAKTTNPSFLAVSADGKGVYTVNENGKREGSGTVTAFRLDKRRGKLTELNRQSSVGQHPCHIALDRTGKWAAVGNYSSGTVTVLRIREDGNFGDSTFTLQHTGSGPNKERQGSPHVHAAVFAPDNKYLLVTDLGTDEIRVYAFNQATGQLSTRNAQTGGELAIARVAAGSGPRHLAFHPNGKWLYAVQELSGTVTSFQYSKGLLVQKGEITILPSDYRGAPTSAHVQVSPDGRFLYASNRNPSNTIAIFRIDAVDGSLHLVGHHPSGGKAPRHFNFDPSGNFLLVANQDTDTIVVFRINRKTGLLSPTGQIIKVPKPVCIQWAR